jgi:hypothetical protein
MNPNLVFRFELAIFLQQIILVIPYLLNPHPQRVPSASRQEMQYLRDQTIFICSNRLAISCFGVPSATGHSVSSTSPKDPSDLTMYTDAPAAIAAQSLLFN